MSVVVVSQAACTAGPPDPPSASTEAASTVDEDRPAVESAERACLVCAFNALYAAVSIYAGGDIAGDASGPRGILFAEVLNVASLLESGEDVDVTWVTSQINTIFQSVLFLARDELATSGPTKLLVARIQGILNVVTTIANCGVAIGNGASVLVDTSIEAYDEVRDALSYDITQKLANDSADVAQGRDCVAGTTFWSTRSYYDQCADCCGENAGGRDGCLAVCNAEYRSSGWFD